MLRSFPILVLLAFFYSHFLQQLASLYSEQLPMPRMVHAACARWRHVWVAEPCVPERALV